MTLIMMTNYTVLKYQTSSEMLHATQYANMLDPADYSKIRTFCHSTSRGTLTSRLCVSPAIP